MSPRRENWNVCCTKAPKDEIIYCSQVTIALIVIIVGLLNITFTENDTCLWSTLISGAVGYLLPGPQIRKDESLLHDTAVQFVNGVLPGQYGGQVQHSSV